MASVGHLSDETQNITSRITVDGRKITYKLSVIQRPERARACGQGAKSTSDRRPVDPPPIVDLVVYEGDEQRDITFSHNANFILFVSLEKARAIAHGRVAHATDNPPVLTGSAVAGMAYLERPSPAGYFIFPDLSVRHEGQYRLEFHLWEHVKDPKDCSAGDTDEYNNVGINGEFYKRRCHVKSSPFCVYSAKKFPGLTESTVLSRTVADQGCRVRIRRDVRMRRRTDKSAKDWDTYEDDTAPQREQRSGSPDAGARAGMPADPADRTRSGSNVSNASAYPQIQQAGRRPSTQSLHQHYNQGFVSPHEAATVQQAEQAQHAVAHVQGHVTSSPGYASQPAYPQTHMPAYPGPYQATYMAQPPPMVSPSIHYQGPQYAYSQQAQVQSSQAQPGSVPPPTMAYGYMPQQPMYEAPMSQVRPDGMEYMSAGQPGFQRTAQPYGQAATSPLGSSDGSSLAKGTSLPPLHRLDASKNEVSVDQLAPPPSEYAGMGSRPAKRTFGSIFNTQHINEPLRHGARPDVMAAATQDLSDGSDEDLNWEALRMTYRRADGTQTVRQWPPA